MDALEQCSDDTGEGVHAVICNQQYNHRGIVELSNSEHDQLSLQVMNWFVVLHSSLMDLGAHGHMFCSALLSKTWYVWLVGEEEIVVKREETVEAKEPATQTKTAFEEKGKALH